MSNKKWYNKVSQNRIIKPPQWVAPHPAERAIRDKLMTDPSVPHKRCKTCGNVYPATREYFHYHPSCKYQVQTECKTCRNKMQAKPIVSYPGELWRDIPGYEGLYQISTHGRIKSIRATTNTFPGKLVKARVNQRGYKSVSLSKDGCTKTPSVHSLVLLTFVGRRPKGMVIHHRDHNKQNNHLDNLMYCTPKENALFSIEFQGVLSPPPPTFYGEEHPGSKLTWDQVAEIRARYEAGGCTHKSLGMEYGVSKTAIGFIVRKKLWKVA